MEFSSKILEKLGIGGPAAAPTPVAPRSAALASPGTVVTAPPPPKPVAEVDVVAQLEQRAKANPQKLNWRTSIVDLLKLLEIDSSFTARKELATELGCPAELMGESAKMNIWLHKTVLARIAANDVLGQIFGSKDVSRAIAQNGASQSGLDPALLKKMLPMLAMVLAGFKAKQQGRGAGAQPSAAGEGLGSLLGSLLDGQASAAGTTAPGATAPGLASMLDLNGDGNPLDDILRMVGQATR